MLEQKLWHFPFSSENSLAQIAVDSYSYLPAFALSICEKEESDETHKYDTGTLIQRLPLFTLSVLCTFCTLALCTVSLIGSAG